MPFEDLYKTEDEQTRRWRVAIFMGVLIFFSFCALFFFFFDKNETDQKPDTTLRAMRLERVRNLCQNLPKPELFNWEKETLPEHNDKLTIVIETYKSTRTFDEIMPFFQIWFSSNGWLKRDRNFNERWATTSAIVTTFHKGNQEISIISSDWTGFHEIECQELEVKPPSK
jgi:hypothetical protein